MIESKIRSIHHEMRQRSTRKKIHQIRYSFWLQNHQQYSQLQQKFLYLVACCKFPNSGYQPRENFLQQLELLISEHCNNWNAYVVISEQVIQLNLLSVLCHSEVSAEVICKFGYLLILNKGFVGIGNENLRSAVEVNRNRLIEGCCQEMVIRLMVDVCGKIALITHQQNIKQLSNENELSSTSTMVALLSQLISTNVDRLLGSQALLHTATQMLELTCQCGSEKPNNIVTQLCQYVAINWEWIMGREFLGRYFLVMGFLLEVYHRQMCSRGGSGGRQSQDKMDGNNGKQDIIEHQKYESEGDRQSILFISAAVNRMLNIVFENEDVGMVYGSKMDNIIALLRLLKNCKIFDGSWYNILDFVLYFGINGGSQNNNGCLEKGRQQTEQEQLTLVYSQSINLLAEVCFQQSWVCYYQFRKHILAMLKRMKQLEQSNLINLFLISESVYFGKSSSIQSQADTNSENILINIIQNLIINQYNHHCDFQYYGILEIVIEDLIQFQMIKKWCSDWRYIQNYQYLFERLCNVKKNKYREVLIGIGEELVRNTYVNSEIKKKIKLMRELYLGGKKRHSQMNGNNGDKQNNYCCDFWKRQQSNQQYCSDQDLDEEEDSEGECSEDDDNDDIFYQ